MDETVEGGKELLAETVRAFKTGLHGQEYTPGSYDAAAIERDEELAKLNELRASGTLSEEEFIAARERLFRPEAMPDSGSLR